MKELFERFWNWYDRNYKLNLTVAAGLFALQIIHLVWLTTDIVLVHLFGTAPIFGEGSIAELFLILVDYTEIPAIITTSLVYIDSLRRGGSAKDTLYLFFLNIQLVHIFWITDEVVFEILHGPALFGTWHPAAAWVAIAIDYLELPVIFETIKRAFFSGEGIAAIRERD